MRGEEEDQGRDGQGRDGRIKELWDILDAKGEGQIDLKGFKRGLKKIDHPLKNADGMLEDTLKAVDTSGDGRIQYEEFRTFVSHTEKELWRLFDSIDRNRDGRIEKEELRAAFHKAGLTVSSKKLDEFFQQVDTNNDGVISPDEWRDFLLFLPASSSNLPAVLSYYTAIGNLNPELDVHINEPLQGLGTAHLFPIRLLLVLQSFLLNVLLCATPPFLSAPAKGRRKQVVVQCQSSNPAASEIFFSQQIESSGEDHQQECKELEYLHIHPSASARMWLYYQYCGQMLTENFPGYFVAGAMAGVVSRTATAPFDRLKVYLIAQTRVSDSALKAAKSGSLLKAARNAVFPLVEATKELWRAGGMRSLFAGNGLNVLKICPESSIRFGSYEASKRMFARLEGHNDPKNLAPYHSFLAGGIAGMVSQCFVYPLDTLKFQMQCETVEGGLHGNRLIYATAKKMWTTNGFHAFFRGLPLGLLGMFPYAAIDLTTFTYLKSALVARQARYYHCHEDDVPMSNFATGAIGAFSGALGASIVYPLNVLRTRMQSQGSVLHPYHYTGIVDVSRKTVQAEGVRGLYRGITPNLLKVVPSVSISYIVYENSKRLFGLD